MGFALRPSPNWFSPKLRSVSNRFNPRERALLSPLVPLNLSIMQAIKCKLHS